MEVLPGGIRYPSQGPRTTAASLLITTRICVTVPRLLNYFDVIYVLGCPSGCCRSLRLACNVGNVACIDVGIEKRRPINAVPDGHRQCVRRSCFFLLLNPFLFRFIGRWPQKNQLGIAAEETSRVRPC